MQTSKFNLEDVKRLVTDSILNKESVWFSATSCSTDYVIHMFKCSESKAMDIILNGILKLVKNNFCQRVLIWDDIADEYGLENYLGYHWYIKFMIGSDYQLEEISFHPCEKDMKLANGKILRRSISGGSLPPWRQK